MRAQESLEEILFKLVGGAPAAALVRRAKAELTSQELATLSPNQQQKWHKLSAPARRLEWSEARRCEAELRAKLGPDAKTSISHTRHERVPIVFAIGVVGSEPVGVDVELASRGVSESAARRFTLADEAGLELDPLQLWVIKEAVMKANPGNSGTVPGQYRVTSVQMAMNGAGIGTADWKQKKFRFALAKTTEWVFAVACS